MRPLAVALFAALLCATLSLSGAGGIALAAKSDAAAAVSKENRAKGMAAAPGLVSAAGSDCQVSDARFIGENKDAKTKTTRDFYEIACTGAEGLVMLKSGDAAPTVFTCEEAGAPQADGKPSNLACILPGNIDPKAGLIPYLTKAGVSCTPTKARPIGHNETLTAFEVACSDGQGYVLQTSAPPRLDKPIKAVPCIAVPAGDNISCTLTSATEALAAADKLMAQSGKACAIKDRRYIGASTQSGDRYYEFACQDGKGYMVEASTAGAFKRVIDCAAAEGIGGGCTLTNSRAAQTAQLDVYTDLSRKAGFNCNVSKYAPLPVNVPGHEVVELACSNRPDGAIAIFTSNGVGSTILDCAHSELKSYRCSFTPASAAFPKLTADLRGFGKTSCAVSNARVVGVSPDQQGYIEVACADGLPGYMIQYSMAPFAPKAAIVCAEAGKIGGGCSLPGNAKRG